MSHGTRSSYRPGDERWVRHLPVAHGGTCRWRNHPIHQVRIWAVYLVGKVWS